MCARVPMCVCQQMFTPNFCIFIRSSLSENEGTRRFTESDSQASSNEPGPSTKRDNIATFYDMKICYSTVSGYNAFRDPVEGSWYIQILCKVFAEHAHDTHLEDLLKIVGEQMNVKRTELDHLQTVSNEDRGFNKNLYFNPGFYGCENQWAIIMFAFNIYIYCFDLYRFLLFLTFK